MATYDHVSLELHRQKTPLADALALAEGSGTSYSQRLNDQWNIAGIKSNDGFPTITSHYGYHMTSWHLVFALSGQVADFSHAANATLTCSPRYDCGGTGGYSVPVMLPGVVGVLRCAQGEIEIELLVGTIVVHRLAVGGAVYPTSPATLAAGKIVRWKAS